MMQGDPRVDRLIYPVELAIRRHVKDSDAITDIYNRAYEALMEVTEALDVSAKVTAKQIAKSAFDLQRAERAEAENAELRKALAHIGYQVPADSVRLNWVTEYKGLQGEARAALEKLGACNSEKS